MRSPLALMRKLLRINVQAYRTARIRQRRRAIEDYTSLMDVVRTSADCCFVLSTGRCGTEYLTRLLELSPNLACYHTPTPELITHSRIVYESQAETKQGFELGVEMARYELIMHAYLTHRQYVETNNRITFFAEALLSVFPQARFIHLVRNPASFVRSGIRRGYYTGRTLHDAGRIVPRSDAVPWPTMSQLEKVAWLWNETNQYIEDFKATSCGDRILLVRAEDMFGSSARAQAIY